MSKVPVIEIGFDEELESLIGTKRQRDWTGPEEAKMKRYYGKVPTPALARILDRSICSVQSKAATLGLTARSKA